MLKIINPVRQISVTEAIQNLFESKENPIVFYRSKNDINGVPSFLKVVETQDYSNKNSFTTFRYQAHFESPIFSRNPSYIGFGNSKTEALRNCIEKINGTRTVYFLEDPSELFKQQKQI